MKLRELSRLLSSVVPIIRNKFTTCLRRHHRTLPSENKAVVVFGNLRLLRDCIVATQIILENCYSRALDDHHGQTEEMLRNLMQETRNNPSQRWPNTSHITFEHFSTLAVGRWVNDEIINYFIQKWCTEAGTTLGLNTFFACKLLFQQNDCRTAKSSKLSIEDETLALRWCQKAQKRLGLKSWDAVFIPIHENSSHWYSAYIDFSRKRIEIYDSLRETCESNRPKPLRQRKNTNLMLVRL
ncbi:hypothetical protein D9757_006537 [Collybiopsis confluens]|uniref:Ubiquitin-like protease family profile domain-containing protein n=1 Tax=Collybiopsis confluens TaxID=2823264 RepID=A0A8H5HQU3_9AGAR|nr:hypothetical protein D9757_006537 [Collybiopsis confluens]